MGLSVAPPEELISTIYLSTHHTKGLLSTLLTKRSTSAAIRTTHIYREGVV